MSKSLGLSSNWVKLIAKTLEKAGLNSRQIFEKMNIDYNKMNKPHSYFEQDALIRLWNEATRLSENPAIGLIMGQIPVIGAFDEFSYSLLSSENMHAAVKRMIRYQRLIGEAPIISLEHETNGYRLVIGSRGNEHLPAAYQGYDATFAIFLESARWIAQKDIRPIEAEFVQPTPENIQPYEALFRCSLEFNRPRASLLIREIDFNSPSPTGNKSVADRHDQSLHQLMVQLDKNALSRDVINYLIKELPDGEPPIEKTVAYFNMSKRTFQRRLKNERCTYLELIETTRKNMVLNYLSRQDLTLQQITFLLGFSEHSNFYRAFKRWYGMTPHQYRQEKAFEFS